MLGERFLALSSLAFVLGVPSPAMERTAMQQLLQMAHSQPDTAIFRDALAKSLGEDRIKKGTAFDSNGPDFIFAVESSSAPSMILDDQPVSGLHQISGSDLWFYAAQLRTGVSHRFHYMVDGARMGGSYDVPAYTPDSYARPGVPQGKISEKLVHTSKLYDGMQSNYWIWVPAEYNPTVPAALMVWQDGERYITHNKEEYCQLCPSLYRLQEVTDNLIHDKKIPVMIHVFVSPGTLNGKSLRSIEYDTVSDKYYQFLEQELLPEVYAKYNIRKDAYSRAIQGQSSGELRHLTPPGTIRMISAGSIRWSAASRRSPGSRANWMAVTSTRSRSAASRSATCGCGQATDRKIRKPAPEAGRCKISSWPIP